VEGEGRKEAGRDGPTAAGRERKCVVGTTCVRDVHLTSQHEGHWLCRVLQQSGEEVQRVVSVQCELVDLKNLVAESHAVFVGETAVL
jgi:hypothetical protein